jgi:hypothetical protein
MSQSSMMTFLRGRVRGGRRDHSYASVWTNAAGNSPSIASAIVLIARNSGPPGVPSSSMMRRAVESLQ